MSFLSFAFRLTLSVVSICSFFYVLGIVDTSEATGKILLCAAGWWLGWRMALIEALRQSVNDMEYLA